MLSIKLMRLYRTDIHVVQTADVDVDLIRIGARYVKSMDAAGRAERVLGGTGVELIRRQCIRAARELELLRPYNQMQKALLGADRAIALGHARKVGGDAETHASAM